MNDDNRSNLYTFTRVFLMVFTFVVMYIFAGIIFTFLLGELLGSVAFFAVLIAIMSVPAWAKNIMSYLDGFACKIAGAIETAADKIGSMMGRWTSKKPADTVVEPTAAEPAAA